MEFEDRAETSAGARLFVYGTLRKGFPSHGLLQRLHARFLGAGHVHGRLYDLGEYPGAVKSAGNTDRVHGEVYLVPRPDAVFRVLDRFEGYDPAKPEFTEFERKQTVVTLAGGREMWAWIYWLPRARASGCRVMSGNYARHRT
jgi:gamma-glutamylcyclotransferase (GGCT)/AIG2-like uncharacterized protein YtfP